MPEYILNPAATVEQVEHPDPNIRVYVVDNFLANPELLVDYAESKAYFGKVGDDRTVYPGIRDRLPGSYENVLTAGIELVYGQCMTTIHRCMLSLTTLEPQQLSPAQRIPHTDAFGDDQFASVHYLCGPPHGGTAIYRYLPRDLVRLSNDDREVVREMLQQVSEYPDEHRGYIAGDTGLYRQEVLIEARFNRLVFYPSNLLHCAVLNSEASLSDNVGTGRLTVASFFQLGIPA